MNYFQFISRTSTNGADPKIALIEVLVPASGAPITHYI